MTGLARSTAEQQERNNQLVAGARYLGPSITSQVRPLQVDVEAALSDESALALEGLQVEAARTAVRALAQLATIGELDHLGGGLELIPPLLLTMTACDYERVDFTIEHAHTSIGYYGALAALGFVDADAVVDGFRRGLDIPGHVAWLPGGTQLNGGRLGVMIPVAVGQALGKRARHGSDAWVIAHCGDAGWISGQALDGFNGADALGAPITFVMHRNGIQLSGTTASIMDKDPRPIISSLGVNIIEIPSLHDLTSLHAAYGQARGLAREGRPSLIYPTGFSSADGGRVDLSTFAGQHGIGAQVEAFAAEQGVAMDTDVWIPGSLMSYRDVGPMLECLFLVNGLPGGEGHHDGHMKDREEAEVLANPMMQQTAAQQAALAAIGARGQRRVVTAARPASGSANLALDKAALSGVELPAAGTSKSPRAGSEAAYAAVAAAHPDEVFVVSCDLDASTKLGKARGFLAPDHQFEMSIEEQAAALMANGLAMANRGPQLTVFSTFAAFFEGIAREGFDLWRYQRNLSGANEGLNVTFHLSHVGAATGRDHFSGWGLDWINVGLTYLPYLHRFYAPADARAAFLAVVDLAAHYGGHVIGVPRDDGIPILEKQDGGALWEPDAAWEPVTTYRNTAGARRAILALGAPAFLAGEAAGALAADGTPVDVHLVNGLPLSPGALEKLIAPYDQGVATIEDGLIGTPATGLRGFAGLVATAAPTLPRAHLGITDPSTAPSEGFLETWTHFGLTAEALRKAVEEL